MWLFRALLLFPFFADLWPQSLTTVPVVLLWSCCDLGLQDWFLGREGKDSSLTVRKPSSPWFSPSDTAQYLWFWSPSVLASPSTRRLSLPGFFNLLHRSLSDHWPCSPFSTVLGRPVIQQGTQRQYSLQAEVTSYQAARLGTIQFP